MINSGRPIVHPDDDLIVSHIAFDIGTEEKMNKLIRYSEGGDNDLIVVVTRGLDKVNYRLYGKVNHKFWVIWASEWES